jgi:predicted nucleotidyltransferase
MLLHPNDCPSREELRKRVIAAFSSQDEVYRVCLFGREAEGKQDCYSDLDVVVFSNDLAVTKAKYQSIFASISPIRAVFRLEATPGQYSEMVQLVDYSPYQKVDFSIAAEGQCNWNFLVVYESQNKSTISATKLETIPIIRDVSYTLSDVLFSVARFTKCLFRQDIDMYRRWASISEVALALLYEKHFGWETETDKSRLGSSAINRLYNDLDPTEKTQVDRIRPPDGKLDIALSYQASIELIIELSWQKAEHFGICLDTDFIEYIRTFMQVEMARYNEQFRQKIASG